MTKMSAMRQMKLSVAALVLGVACSSSDNKSKIVIGQATSLTGDYASGAAMTYTALVAPGGIFLSVIIGVFSVSKLLNVYRGILVYTREHNLAYVQEKKKEQGIPTTARDKFKDFAVRITPRRR